ncbi:MAG: M24 family metallopeptidase [Gammaproteobacteria bacterium]|jgi:Xaa-Pro aminopeptidase|nr:MAG: M24 family metallopeptidase [Gammaproteobacteria bacterium]|tara:strand:- start:7589 stop:8830 length:1242 start_codon:yes stop_codon:yes gene_type:complete
MDIFSKRRHFLSNQLESNSVAILFGSEETLRNGDVNFPFRQNSNFSYLTNFPESESIAVLDNENFIIFCKEKNKLKEQWDGEILGPENTKLYGATQGIPINDYEKVLPGLVKDRDNIYCFESFIPKLKKLLPDLETIIKPLDYEVSKMRTIKSADELKIIEEACRISSLAHIRAMKSVKPGMYEYQLEAEYVHEFMSHGARACAYPSIVGGGKNACVLHYNENKNVLNDGDLVLVDAGCEFNNYASDITRTFPVNGKFSKEQREIYEIVLEASKKSIETVISGSNPLKAHETSVEIISQGLLDLGLLDGDLNEIIESNRYFDFYMHRVGHYMGLDVHDVGGKDMNGEWLNYAPGMITTIEPGIYINENLDVPEKYKNIGIRIEDNVVVTETGFKVLTDLVPKEVNDIESLMNS